MCVLTDYCQCQAEKLGAEDNVINEVLVIDSLIHFAYKRGKQR